MEIEVTLRFKLAIKRPGSRHMHEGERYFIERSDSQIIRDDEGRQRFVAVYTLVKELP